MCGSALEIELVQKSANLPGLIRSPSHERPRRELDEVVTHLCNRAECAIQILLDVPADRGLLQSNRKPRLVLRVQTSRRRRSQHGKLPAGEGVSACTIHSPQMIA